jgi:hypothetical protein
LPNQNTRYSPESEGAEVKAKEQKSKRRSRSQSEVPELVLVQVSGFNDRQNRANFTICEQAGSIPCFGKNVGRSVFMIRKKFAGISASSGFSDLTIVVFIF